MGISTSGTNPDVLDPRFQRIFHQTFDDLPDMIPDMYNMTAHNGRADGRHQYRGAGNVQSASNVFVFFAGDRFGQRFQRAVEHLGGQHDRDAQSQQAPLNHTDLKSDSSGHDQQRRDEVDRKTTLSAHTLPRSAKRIAELSKPRTLRRLKIVAHSMLTPLVAVASSRRKVCAFVTETAARCHRYKSHFQRNKSLCTMP